MPPQKTNSKNWIVEQLTEAAAKKLTRQHLLGYCELPQKNIYYDFLLACRALGIEDYEDPDTLD